ncbi:methylated-DNA--[protein]-cysteine S-methyltransferase, partial [Planktotalea frisia]|uniref:methylated-DNA--[protein]-cysteine S-methyltransferase n=2 Tax=Planktotalea frisia TaxID=696762 RepID=UPI001FE9467B
HPKSGNLQEVSRESVHIYKRGIWQRETVHRDFLEALRALSVFHSQTDTMTKLSYTYIDSLVGALLVAGDESALHYLCFSTSPNAIVPRLDWQQTDAPFLEVRRQINAYFEGDLRKFDLPLFLTGTDFQKSVWQHLSKLPFGEAQSYGQLAAALERPKASRAVGAANGSNPNAIILPCHRVIGANGSLTGFCGGLATKEHLLCHEGVLTPSF